MRVSWRSRRRHRRARSEGRFDRRRQRARAGARSGRDRRHPARPPRARGRLRARGAKRRARRARPLRGGRARGWQTGSSSPAPLLADRPSLPRHAGQARLRRVPRGGDPRRRGRRPGARPVAPRRPAPRCARGGPCRDAPPTASRSASTTAPISPSSRAPTSSTWGRTTSPSRLRGPSACRSASPRTRLPRSTRRGPTTSPSVPCTRRRRRKAGPRSASSSSGYAAANATLPWFAIGGIDAANVADVVAAGATRVAVVRAIVEADDPERAARELRAALPD